MKVFHCDHCDQLVFFESVHCVRCEHPLAYLPDLGVTGSLDRTADGLWRSPLARSNGRSYRLCRNYTEHNVCNWAVPADDAEPYCRSCRLTRVIPNLDTPGNKEAWYKLEVAKRRLLYTLMALKLPGAGKREQPETGLAFDFLADPTDPAAPPVLTGHDDGLITVNLAEADDAERERRRHQMREPYRTVLGHFRHEVGHYYWDVLIKDGPHLARFRELFGDDRAGLLPGARELLQGRRPAGLAGAVHLRVRDRPPVGGLGRDMGALPAHDRHAGDRRRVRAVGEAQAGGRAGDETGAEGAGRRALGVRRRAQGLARADLRPEQPQPRSGPA